MTENDEPWFIAKDVCDILEISNPSDALKRLDDDERSRFNLGRQGETNIVNDGDYCPSNCRWVTRAENMRNTSRTHPITINGKTQCASDWIKELGIGKSTFYAALRKGPSTCSSASRPWKRVRDE